MKESTKLLMYKYKYFDNVIFDDRNELFRSCIDIKNDNNYCYIAELLFNEFEMNDPDSTLLLQRFNFETFNDARCYILLKQFDMMSAYKNYNAYINKTMKRFNKDKLIIKIKHMVSKIM